eukprot:Pgem_evm1s7616
MCGLGTFPIAVKQLYKQHQKHFEKQSLEITSIMGCDMEVNSVNLAKKLSPDLDFKNADSSCLDHLADGCIDIVICDPPWGHRH